MAHAGESNRDAQAALAHARAPNADGRAGDHPERGLVILRASRLEALVPPLQALLSATRPMDLLAPQSVIAAHPGMKQWLTGALARHLGPARVVANLLVHLPSAWLEQLAMQQLGQQAVSLPRYQRRHLRWSLYQLLDPHKTVAGMSDLRLASYLKPTGEAAADAADLARRRFQLADRLAGIYSQYLIYRPDWLAAWESGTFRFATATSSDAALRALEAQLLAPLWRQLQQKLGIHRAAAINRLHAVLEAAGPDLPPLHLFGVSHLPPSELAVLRAYARHAPVMLYVPDPCREYWGGLVRYAAHPGLERSAVAGERAQWQLYADAEAARMAAAGEGEYWHEQAHPLLARWGRMGQHFFASLGDGEVREDQRHWQDEVPAPTHRLSRLQESIRHLDVSLMQEPGIDAKTCEDASLRVHACHTRLRELEVLRDALLDAIDRDGVRAGDIVVMAPDISAYAPLIPSVFGEAGSRRQRLLPYHLADVPVCSNHGLFNTFERLLEIAASRVTTPEVADLLSVPEVQRRLGLDAGAVDNLVEWIGQSHVAWALDGQHRRSFGVPGTSEYSFAWAMDRMIAGYLMSDASDADRARAFTLPDGTELLPVTGLDGPGAEALGALDTLLIELQRWHALTGTARKASAWAVELQERLDALFRIDRMDAEARDALAALKKMIAGLANEPARAGEDPSLQFAVVRDLLREALDSVPVRQRFLMGGVTFCGMVPQRAIPFEVVCVLGLNDGEFPRNQSDGGLDLMARLRRVGDRDVGMDDRYLFLETVMSARKRLHLGFIGEGVKDGKRRNPAAPLAELLAELDRAAGLSADADDTRRPWLVRHPLQPFDQRYFQSPGQPSDPRLFTYQSRFAGMWGNGQGAAPRFLDGATIAPDPLPHPLPLATLTRFFKHPAEHVLKTRLQLDRDVLSGNALPESEPLDAQVGSIHVIARRVFFQDALPAWFEGSSPVWNPAAIPDWLRLSGLLPPGAAGVRAWQKESNAVLALLGQAQASQALDAEVARAAHSLDIDLDLSWFSDLAEPLRLVGVLQDVFPLAGHPGGLQLVRAFPASRGKPWIKRGPDLHFGDLVPMFLEWALLRLQTAAQVLPDTALAPIRMTVLAKPDPTGCALVHDVQQWDSHLLLASASTRADMLGALAGKVRVLIGFWQQAQQAPPWYFPRASWAAWAAFNTAQAEVAAAAAAEGKDEDEDTGAPPVDTPTPDDPRTVAAGAANNKWLGHWDYVGERDQVPGYNQLLAGETIFGDDATDPDGLALDGLLACAGTLAGLIRLTVPGGTP